MSTSPGIDAKLIKRQLKWPTKIPGINGVVAVGC
jgi:hypothetical protein